MDGWPLWLRVLVGCPLAVLIVLVGMVFTVFILGDHRGGGR